MSPTLKRCYIMLCILFFITYGYFFQGGGWNQNSRICLTRAIIHHQTFIIDNFKEDYKDPYFEFVNTGDWAYFNGHYYSVKPPGLSFMAVVPFAIAEYFLQHIFHFDIAKQVWLSAYISTLFTTVVCSVILCLIMFHVFLHFLKIEIQSSFLLVLFFGFGTLAFSYSTTFYSYLPAACFSFLAFVFAMHINHGNSQRKIIMALFSGFAASSAVLVEASTVLTLGCILGYLFSSKDGRKNSIFFLFGCIPPGILQYFYNSICFGGPLNLSYQYANEEVMWYVNGWLFSIPHSKDFMGILFLPYRGLFVSSPVYLMALPGTLCFLKQRKWIKETIFCIILSVIYIVFIASFNAWHGGTTVGPRYLIPVFPFAFMLTAFALVRFPKIFKTIGVLSILINLSITIVGNEIPINIHNPLCDVVLKNVLQGKVSINPSPFSNFENYPHAEKFFEIEKWPVNFNSFNLGELIFPHAIASILPLGCFWTIWGCVWMRQNRNKYK